jgi:hypothetical protein
MAFRSATEGRGGACTGRPERVGFMSGSLLQEAHLVDEGPRASEVESSNGMTLRSITFRAEG